MQVPIEDFATCRKVYTEIMSSHLFQRPMLVRMPPNNHSGLLHLSRFIPGQIKRTSKLVGVSEIPRKQFPQNGITSGRGKHEIDQEFEAGRLRTIVRVLPASRPFIHEAVSRSGDGIQELATVRIEILSGH